MLDYEPLVKSVAMSSGGYREKSVISKPHTIEKGETWNTEHRVIYVLEKEPQPDGYRNGFAVDIATGSICG